MSRHSWPPCSHVSYYGSQKSTICVKSYVLSGIWQTLNKCLLLVLPWLWLSPSWSGAQPKAMWLFCAESHQYFWSPREGLGWTSWRMGEQRAQRVCLKGFWGSSLCNDIAAGFSYSWRSFTKQVWNLNGFLCRTSTAPSEPGCLEVVGPFSVWACLGSYPGLMSPEADPETRICEQVRFLGGDPRKHY